MTSTLHSAWHDANNAEAYDTWAYYPGYLLRKRYESLNEIRLLKSILPEITGTDFLEIGCASGELYRYLKNEMPQFDYLGTDISEPAIQHACKRFGPEHFALLDEEDSNRSLRSLKPRSIVFCRDVIFHQESPYAFLADLLSLTREVLVLRLRTRETGDTVFDAERSCQIHYGAHWVPYIVLNMQELLGNLKKDKRVQTILVSRRFEPLGGHNGRFLPKELYYPESGTAETAILVRLGDTPFAQEPRIIFDDQPDGAPFSVADRIVLRLLHILRHTK